MSDGTFVPLSTVTGHCRGSRHLVNDNIWLSGGSGGIRMRLHLMDKSKDAVMVEGHKGNAADNRCKKRK